MTTIKKITKIQNLLEKLLDNNLMIGYHFEAIDSIAKYPEEYEFGKHSYNKKICIYGHTIKDINSYDFYKQTGLCLTCEHLKGGDNK